jgi:hypothetical protein
MKLPTPALSGSGLRDFLSSAATARHPCFIHPPLKHKHPGLEKPDCRTAGLPDCRTAGLPDCRTAGLPDCRTAGLPGPRWRFAPGARPDQPSWRRMPSKPIRLQSFSLEGCVKSPPGTGPTQHQRSSGEIVAAPSDARHGRGLGVAAHGGGSVWPLRRGRQRRWHRYGYEAGPARALGLFGAAGPPSRPPAILGGGRSSMAAEDEGRSEPRSTSPRMAGAATWPGAQSW